jgi:anthranilate synthase/aminodeoxychorismate synthase-like glutamine amidotransferase
MILLLDNYDSFVWNLARYVRELGRDAVVRRNDAITLAEVETLAPSHIIISPGPCTPAEAGASVPIVQQFGPSIPTFGVCLGHQVTHGRARQKHKRNRSATALTDRHWP